MMGEVKIVENRETFMLRLQHYCSADELRLIDFAYDLAKEAHRDQRRDSGERYFEHGRQVALILMDECRIFFPHVIIPALIHDTIEDSPIFGNRTQPRSEWVATARWRLERIFDKHIAEVTIAVTKPSVDTVEFTTKPQAAAAYIEQLQKASSVALLVKAADRLHNLRSLNGTTVEKQRKTIEETRLVYLPLFTDYLLPAAPDFGQRLLDKMNVEMVKYPDF